LEKPVSPDTGLGMKLGVLYFKGATGATAMERDEYVSSLDDKLQTQANSQEEALQDEGIIGDCIYAKPALETGVIDGLRGKTSFDIRWYEHPNAKILWYFWVEGNDLGGINLQWTGPRSLDLDTDDTIEPLNDAYDTFEYYG